MYIHFSKQSLQYLHVFFMAVNDICSEKVITENVSCAKQVFRMYVKYSMSLRAPWKCYDNNEDQSKNSKPSVKLVYFAEQTFV